MKLQLKDWKVRRVSFNIIEDKDRKTKNSFNLSFGSFLFEGKFTEFEIGFEVKIEDDDFTLEAEMVFHFESDNHLPKDFKDSPFLNINAPAIAFPFLRAFISNFTLQSGFNPIILPSVNFFEFENRCKKETILPEK